MSATTFSLKLYKRSEGNEKQPIVLLVSWRGNKSESRRKHLGVSCLEQDWDSNRGFIKSSAWGAVKTNKELKECLEKAVRIYKENFENKEWNYVSWAKLYDSKNEKFTFDSYAEELIVKLFKANRAGTAIYYRDCLKALQKFLGEKTINFEDITKSLLKQVETDITDRGYKGERLMRGLKTIYSTAVEDEVVDKNMMPFKCGYNPTGYKFNHLKKLRGSRKKPLLQRLSVSEASKLLHYTPKNDSHIRALDLWKFSYYTMGVNLKDIALMKITDVKDGIWYYEREKTSEGGKGKLLLPECLKLIEKYQNPENKYIFSDILRDCYDSSDETIKYRTRDYLSNLRRRYEEISKDLGLPGHFSFYSARFTSSTISANKGGNMKAIQTLMDHASITTTEGYALYSNLGEQKTTLELLRV